MKSFTRQIAGIALVGLLLQLASQASAGEINTGYFGNVAIKGYDPVAYFTEQKPVKGNQSISHNWLGAEWQFSNMKHKDLFVQNPVKYAPQYGGFCADGVAYETTTTNIDPNAWRIIDGKLYLNFDEGAAIEIEEIEGQIDRANENWPKIRAGLLANSE